MNFDKAKILSIEDEPLVRMSILNWLEDSGYTVFGAETGEEGLKLFAQEKPDIVLLDMGLPDKHGLDVLRAILRMEATTPVIVVSGRAEIFDAIAAFKAGAWDYLTKPIDHMDMLERTVVNCLERKNLRREVAQANQRYQRLVQNVPVIIFSLRPDLSVDFINDVCLDRLGYQPADVLRDKDWMIQNVLRDDRERMRQAFLKAFETGKLEENFKFRHKNGYIMYMSGRCIHLAYSGSDGGKRIQGTLNDITDRLFLDKLLMQREKLNTIGAISNQLAHEIRNPLMALGGFARMLEKKHPEMEEARVILTEARRIEKLMKRISDYLAPLPVEPEPCQINELLRKVLDDLKGEIHLELVTRFDKALPDIVSDRAMLEDIFVATLRGVLKSVRGRGLLGVNTREIAGHVVCVFDAQSQDGTPIEDYGDDMMMPFDEETEAITASFKKLKDLGGNFSHERSSERVTFAISLPGARTHDG